VTRVKVCGVTRIEDAVLAAELGAFAVGFIFWPQSRRYVEPERARAIAATLPPRVVCVGVFVDQPLDEIRRIAHMVPLGAVQLHGAEKPEIAAALVQPVIKAMPVGEGFDPASMDAWPADVTVLLDTHDPVRRGGTGRTIDWTAAAIAARRRPVMLSGGLTPENVRVAIDTVRPYAVDLASGIEAFPGVKDHDKLRSLFRNIAAAQDQAQT